VHAAAVVRLPVLRALPALAALLAAGSHVMMPSELSDPRDHRDERGSTRVLALGDSYTIGEGVAAQDRWPVQLVRALRERGVAFDRVSENGEAMRTLPLEEPRIIARTGWTTDELSAAIDAIEREEGPLPRDHALVTLLIGVNNQYRGRSVDDYAPQFAALLDRAVGYAGGDPGHVLVLGFPDWGVTPFAAASGRDLADNAAEVDAYNAAAARICAERRVAFVDIADINRSRGAEPAMLTDDGLHPSASMYAEWARLALPVALSLLTHVSATPHDIAPHRSQ
jgi:lysophospholipase L1-like esterase